MRSGLIELRERNVNEWPWMSKILDGGDPLLFGQDNLGGFKYHSTLLLSICKRH